MNPTVCRWMSILIVAGFFSTAGTASARPPSDLRLSYDVEKKNLHIEADHVTSNPRKHFIRKLFIDKNGTQIDSRSYVQQTTATMLVEDIPLEAVTGDIVRVEAVCNTAGRKETTLVIP